MRKTVHKWFWMWDFDKEEQWLNEMASKGLALAAVGFCRYEFEECEPGEYKVCLEMLDPMPGSAEGQKYIQFVEETGAEHVGNFTRWAYFRKKGDPEFCLYSDIDSRITYVTRIMRILLAVTILNLFIGAENIFIFLRGMSSLNDINIIGVVNLAIGVLGLLGYRKLNEKRSALKALKEIFE